MNTQAEISESTAAVQPEAPDRVLVQRLADLAKYERNLAALRAFLEENHASLAGLGWTLGPYDAEIQVQSWSWVGQKPQEVARRFPGEWQTHCPSYFNRTHEFDWVAVRGLVTIRLMCAE